MMLLMSVRTPLSESLARFRDNINDLVDVDFAIYQYDALARIVKNTVKVNKEIGEILDELGRSERKELPYKLFFVYLVTALEVYLKDRIEEEFEKNSESVVRFLRGFRPRKKISIDDVYAGPKAYALSLLDSVSFHNLKQVDALYKIVFGFDIIPLGDYKNLAFIVRVRHDIIHRGGRVKGKTIRVLPGGFVFWCQKVSNFVEAIDYYCRFGKKRKRFPRLYMRYDKEWDRLLEWEEYRQTLPHSISWDTLGEKEDEEIAI